QDFLLNSTHAIFMHTDQPPFNDVRVRRAISLSIDQLGAGAQYYQYSPKEARRLLAEAGYAHGFHTQLTVTPGYGRDLIDDAQLVQSYLKDVGIEAELKIQEYGAYIATTVAGKYEGVARGP